MPRKAIVGDGAEKQEAPQADLVFDAVEAGEWLASFARRLRGVFRSVRFEPEGIDPQQISFLLTLASQAIRGEYKLKREVRRGVLYVPLKLAGSEALQGMQRREERGGYVAFHRKG